MSNSEVIMIRDILERLSNGEKTSEIAKSIDGIGETKFRTALKEAGYLYKQTGKKGWYFQGEGQEPLDHNIFDYVNNRSPKVISSNIKEEKSNKAVNGSNTKVKQSNIGFTEEEIQEIRLMLEERRNNQTLSPLHERIKQIEQDEKTRKTIVLDKQLGERLDKFCKSERVNKSDVIYLALLDFLERY